jgi:hypothetical protein
MKRFICQLCFVGFLLLAQSCDAVGPKKFKVTGTVTFDGQPVDSGEIIFVPEEKELAPDSGKIKKGSFTAQVTAGKKRVQIRASRLVPGMSNPMGPVREDYIPARYNSQSELTAEVTPNGANHWNFPLKSDGK